MKQKNTAGKRSWHALSAQAICDALASNEHGLTSDEAELRRRQYGFNRLTQVAVRSVFERMLGQFNNVLIYVLLIAAAITAGVEHWVDSGVIVGVVLVNALIGFLQEGKAEKALDAIRSLLTHQTLVRRDGKNFLMSAEALVPGDIVTLESGDKVPADLRLLKVKNLRINESMLTGESLPVEKNTGTVSAIAALGDRFCMAYSGTLVTYGSAVGIVVDIGDETEIGRISAMLSSVPQLVTPLLKQIDRFSRWLSLAIVLLAMSTLFYGFAIQHSTMVELFMSAVGLAVAAIPEGLPAIMTITLAIGVQRMATRHAIIRRLPAVETLGSVTVICSDKTGTLTCNEMTVKSVFVNNVLFNVEGTGYNPHGGFEINNSAISVDDYPSLHELTRAAALCNNAGLEQQGANWVVHGDPTEGALITLALKAGFDPDFLNQEMPRTDVIPFESEHRYMATLHHDHSGHAFVFIKGAPEQVLAMCAFQRIDGQDQPIHLDHWHRTMERMAGSGQRLLAVAFKVVDVGLKQIGCGDIGTGLTLLGMVGMIDPPRPEAVKAVNKCREAGINVKMITGDHAVTAVAIAAQLEIGNGSVLTGDELDRISDSELAETVRRIDVFARTSPENKLRLVTALQASGQVVAMTGDGVNDGPALKRADVGIAMGKKGTEVAKECSEMVLVDDNFASIADAVEEGRGVYDNLKKSILFILPTNGGEAFIIVAAIIMGETLPITPVQILWVNMITAVTLALTLAFEPPEHNIMRRKPRQSDEPLLSAFLAWRIVFVAAIMVTGSYGLFLWELSFGESIERARTVAVNTLVMYEIFYVFNSRYLLDSVWNPHGLFGNRIMWFAVVLLIGFQLAFTYWRPMQLLFGSADIELMNWQMIVAVGSTVFILVEIEKWFIRYFVSKAKDDV